MPQADYIPLRSEEIQEIMERTPGWMMRWGISLFFALICVLLVTSWFIQYPDVIQTSITITSQNPPVNLVAQSSGKLNRLFVSDKEMVDSNRILALIDNPANFIQVQSLEKELIEISYILQKKELDSLKPSLHAYQLGEIQGAFSSFKQAMDDYISFRAVGLYEHKIKATEHQAKSQEVLYNRILQQFQTLTEEYQLATVKCQTDSQLYANGVIPKMQFNDSRSTLLQKKYSWQGTNSTLAQTQVQIGELQKAVTELQLQYQTEESKYLTGLTKSLETLQAAIKMWEQKYVILSPVKGQVNLFNYSSVNAPVKQGDVLMIITPVFTGETVGRINLPAFGSAKVKEGQNVNIKLSNYPSDEFGMLMGRIESVSMLPKDSMYAVRISFPEGLKTSYGKKLEFKQQMTGTAEIITEKKRLLERMLNKVKIRI
jgi:multidrug efflux pump subunit AcrA (membrane-fusion protein)